MTTKLDEGSAGTLWGKGLPRSATAVAHPNIALAKYWGKRAGEGNYPAVPSLSLTLDGLSTRTTLRFGEDLAEDVFRLNGQPALGVVRERAVALVDRIRRLAGLQLRFEGESFNDFPTASGLASSASGFAALSLAASAAAGLPLSMADVSDQARRSSASAARSLFGGFVELPAGPSTGDGTQKLPALPLFPPDHLDLRVLVCVTSEDAKAVGSTDGMLRTARESPYFDAWLTHAPVVFRRLRDALGAKDFTTVGECMEASTWAMHASAMAAGVSYMKPATVALWDGVRALRRDGVPVYATMDAGPHVKVFVPTASARTVASQLGPLPGVLRILEARPGPGAQLLAHPASPSTEGARP